MGKMKTRPTPILIVFLLTLLHAPDAKADLTMEQAVGLALQRAPEVAASRHKVDAARARIDLARSAYWPRFGLQASYLARWPKMELDIEVPSQMAGLIEIPEMDDVHHFRAGVQGGYRVLDLTRGPRVEAGKAALRADRLSARQTSAMVAYRARAVYLSALFARDAVTLSSQSLSAARDAERRAKQRLTAGTGNRMELAHARVRVATLEAQQARAMHELSRIEKVLANLTGLPRVPRLAGSLERASAAKTPRTALTGHPSVARLQASAAALEASAKSASRGFWPTVTIMAKAEVEYPHVMTTEWGPLVQGGVVMSWSFFDGFQRGSRARVDRARAHGLREASRATRQKLQRQVIQLQSRQQAAAADMASAKKILAQAEVHVRVAREARVQGAATHLEVTNAVVGADRARMGIKRALLNQALVKAELLMVSGDARWSRAGQARPATPPVGPTTVSQGATK